MAVNQKNIGSTPVSRFFIKRFMLKHPFSFLNKKKTKNIVLKSNLLSFFWLPVKTSKNELIFFKNKFFDFCSIKNNFIKKYFLNSNSNLKLLNNKLYLMYFYGSKFFLFNFLQKINKLNAFFHVYKTQVFTTLLHRIIFEIKSVKKITIFKLFYLFQNVFI